MGGGIRFGEMERDSLLAHGVSFMLHDRLMNCSDYSRCYVCSTCGSVLSTMIDGKALLATANANSVTNMKASGSHVICRNCDSGEFIETIAIPYVFRYLLTELAAMNVNVRLDLKGLN